VIGVTDLRRQTISSFWFLTYLVMIFWPAFFVYADQPGPHRNAFLFAVASAVITVPLGALVIARMTGSSRREREAYLAKPIEETRSSTSLFIVFCAIAAVVIGSVLLYFSMLSEIPLLYMLGYPGCDLVLAQLREDTFKLLDPRWNATTGTLLFYLFLPLRTIVDPFIVAALFGLWFWVKERRWAVLFAVVFAVAAFYAAASLARAPVAALVLRMFIVYYVLRAGHVGVRPALAWAAVVLAFPLIVTAAAYRPGPPPTDCGPAANRGPEVGKAALVDPYFALAEVARPSGSPIPGGTWPAFPTGSLAVPTVPPGGAVSLPRVSLAPAPAPTAVPASDRLQSTVGTAILVARRLTYTQAFALYTYFPVFPAEHDWLWGQTLVKPVLRFWGADFYVENFVYQKTYPNSPIPTGHLNASFQSNFYADFGLPGVVVGGVVTGGIMHGIEIYLWRRRKTILELATFAVLVYAFWVLHSGSLTSVLITNGVLPVLLIPPTIRLGESVVARWITR
jgi:hypothetical protein